MQPYPATELGEPVSRMPETRLSVLVLAMAGRWILWPHVYPPHGATAGDTADWVADLAEREWLS